MHRRAFLSSCGSAAVLSLMLLKVEGSEGSRMSLEELEARVQTQLQATSFENTMGTFAVQEHMLSVVEIHNEFVGIEDVVVLENGYLVCRRGSEFFEAWVSAVTWDFVSRAYLYVSVFGAYDFRAFQESSMRDREADRVVGARLRDEAEIEWEKAVRNLHQQRTRLVQ